MDINIKYKEIDKKERVKQALQQAVEECTPWAESLNLQERQVELIDAIYKEDSKQIKSAEIRKETEYSKYILEAYINTDNGVTLRVGSQGKATDGIDFNKSELSQYINLLQQIEKQMEG
jgi:hypothetical protein